MEYEVPSPVNGPRGAAAHPLAIPAAPQGNRCFALRSPTTPACGTAKLDVLSRFASVRHPWRPDLVFRATARRFPAGTHRFQKDCFLLLTKRPHSFGWRLNRRSVPCRPGQPTWMWAEGAVLQGGYLAPDPQAGRHKLRVPRSGDSAVRALADGFYPPPISASCQFFDYDRKS